MARLIVARGGVEERTFELTGDTQIGRTQDCQLQLEGTRLSRKHARIYQNNEDWMVEDTRSTHGTLLNGKSLLPGMAHILLPGDQLALDIWTITFQNQTQIATPAAGGNGAPTRVFPHQSDLVIGRDDTCNIVLKHPNVSRQHCRIRVTSNGHEIEDLRSRNGTFVNDTRLNAPTRLHYDDEIRIGMDLLIYTRQGVEFFDEKLSVRLDAVNLRVTVEKDGQPVHLLNDVNCVMEPRQLVAVVGASGAGKSTLLKALTGFRKANDGQVLINGADYYANLELFRASIGYVPQDDIVHKELTVAEVLRYAARLRLPPDTQTQEIEQLLDRTLMELKLSHRKDNCVSTLSGGERKRVNVGVELLTRPGLLFLDEPTSGLDPGLELEFIDLMRQIANDGRTIVMITHATSSIRACDRILFLARGGRVAYYGPPEEALSYFGVTDYAEVYRTVSSNNKKPEQWEEAFRNSDLYQKYIKGPQQARPAHRRGKTVHIAKRIGATAPRPSASQQFVILTQRYWSTLKGDRRNLLSMLIQAPIIGLLLMTVFPHNIFQKVQGQIVNPNAAQLPFCLVISALLFGCLNACRELAKERPIYLRERLVNLRIWPYLGSKVAVLSLLCVLQSVILVLMVTLKVDFGVNATTICQMTGITCLTTLSGMLLGLLLSAFASTPDQAMSLVPIAILPQIFFSGLIDTDIPKIFCQIMPSYWAYGTLGNLTGLVGRELFKTELSQATISLIVISCVYLAICYFSIRSGEHKST